MADWIRSLRQTAALEGNEFLKLPAYRRDDPPARP
jgi:hypothetical protein